MLVRTAVLAFLLVSAAAASAPTPTSACSCIAAAINWSQPAAGERDVPLDFAPLIAGLYDPDSLVLERSDGTAVSFQLRLAKEAHLCGRLAELLLSQPLEPDTDYRLRGSMGDEESVIEFTTGQRSVEAIPLDPPIASAVVMPFPPNVVTMFDCGQAPRACVAFEDDRDLEIIASVAGQEVDWVLTQYLSASHDEGYVPITAGPNVIPDCVEVRVRDEAGRRSAPSVFCGKALIPIDEIGDDSACQAIAESSGDPLSATADTPSVGCSAAGGQTARGRLGVPAVLFALLLLVTRAKRRRRPCPGSCAAPSRAAPPRYPRAGAR